METATDTGIMLRASHLLGLVAALTSICGTARGITLRVENPTGNVAVTVGVGQNPKITRKSPTRDLRQDDTAIFQQPGLIIVRAHPADGAPINFEIELPYGFELEAVTNDGDVSYSGFVRRVALVTRTGEITIASPLKATRLSVLTQDPPTQLHSPKGFKFTKSMSRDKDAPPRWTFRDKLPDLQITYSQITVNALSPRGLRLEDIPIPEDSPVKMPWQAADILKTMVGPESGSRRSPGASSPRPGSKADGEEAVQAITVEEGVPVFSSNVRMVNLTAAIFDSENHPMLDLTAEDFTVVEDAVPQEVTFAGSEEVPFNLALLLDLSGSTRRDRNAMKEAATRFIDIARPQDRVACYALANDTFQVVSALTADRDELKRLIGEIPQVSGGSPLYDIIVLTYAEELMMLPAERNAIIVISDGIDNRIYGQGTASDVSLSGLKKASESMNAIIYPIFLDPFTTIPAPNWARKAKANMQALADSTGGRLFVAQSIRDLDDVYPLVAEELRSVYTIAYYPKNQNFSGAWRDVTVEVKRPGATVRTRDGYVAR